MIKEIEAKTLLTPNRSPDSWFGMRYGMNIYRGCEHQCIYCDSRSECYQIEDFRDVLVKVNAVELLRRELRSKRTKCIIGTGSMSDPYTWAEQQYDLTGQALRTIAELGFGVHITTKSNLVVKDLETLRAICRFHASVAFTLTTTDDDLAHKIEPGAPSPSARLRAMAALAEAGVIVGTTMMPILPFIEDNEANITAIVARTHEAGGSYCVPGFGMTLRDRQRAYYYRELDRLFPGLRPQYERSYGERYGCRPRNGHALEACFQEQCARYGLSSCMLRPTAAAGPAQLPLL